MSLPWFVGCDGCRRDEAAKDNKNKPPGPSEDITFGQAMPLPSNGSVGTAAIKPGHWFTLRQSMRSNKSDQRGEYSSQAFVIDGSSTAQSGDGNIAQDCLRPVVLPKGRMKQFDSRLLAGLDGGIGNKRLATSGRLSTGALIATPPRTDHGLMRAEEYFLVILTNRPERFVSFQVADWVRPPTDIELAANGPANYRIVFAKSGGLWSIPETMLDMTSTAVVFWDDVSPNELTAFQRQGIIDWVHFGGRLIVNGDTIATELASSEMGGLLPITVAGMMDLSGESTAMLVENWGVQKDDTTPVVAALVRSQASRVAVAGDVADDAMAIVGTDELVAMRRINRGTVVMSRFDLTSEWMLKWRSRDSFFNAAILDRPVREFKFDTGGIRQQYAASDPRSPVEMNTSFRIAGRDLSLTPGELQRPHPISGLGGWRDDSDIAKAMQNALREQAGVKIPPFSFALRSLAFYLVVLVPLNYVVFGFLGRLEWAWLAVPFLALLGAAWIARTVSLDLGLARNQSEVALIELQAGNPRGHITRFASVYNSLSGTYQFEFDSRDAAAAPIGILDGTLGELAPTTFRYGFGDGPVLDQFAVASNRTRLLHSEQVLDFGGSIAIVGEQLQNDTNLTLRDCAAVRRRDAEGAEYANIGELAPGGRVKLNWHQRRGLEPRNMDDGSSLRAKLVEPLLAANMIPLGTSRFVAVIDKPVQGVQLVPEAPRQSTTTVVLVNLGFAGPSNDIVRRDVNLVPLAKEREAILLDGDNDSTSSAPIVVP